MANATGVKTRTGPTPRKSAAKRAKRATPAKRVRSLSASHKEALAEGRTMSAVVDRYIAAVNTPKRRGRKVSSATLTKRLAAKQEIAKVETGVNRVIALQEVRDIERKLGAMRTASTTDVAALEREFVKVAKKFSENRKISWSAWRDAGVPPEVLKKAGVRRTRG